MSSTIDERIVEMKFDNADFEQNVKTSMNTIDKLNDKLDMKGASDGVDKLSKTIKQFTMEPMEKAVDSCKLKFSAFQVAAATAVANITNDIVNKSKQILSEFTIQPISSGFDEYELKMGSVQTIMASTGASIEEVNQYLNDLNTYSDRTIYSFHDMTSNIGKFTNAGVKLKDAVAAIKGISNEAALSGANAEEASRAMYNFSQALSAGSVKLIDWKSIENANMATVEFKKQLLQTAEACGTVQKQSDGMYKVLSKNTQGSTMDQTIDATHNFNDSLNYQWMTTEVLTQTLAKYADETTDIGKRAYAAAEDVKTFSMMMDTLKEAAQSGWAQTSEILFGNFEEAKHTWTTLSNYFSDAISEIDNARNKFLGGALMSNYDQIIDKMNEAGVNTDKFIDTFKKNAEEAGIDVDALTEKYGSLGDALSHSHKLTDVFKSTFDNLTTGIKSNGETVDNTVSVSTDKLEKLQDIANQVIRGDFGNGEERIKALTDAGYDYQTVQDLVNKTLGVGAQSTDNLADTVNNLSDEQLKNLGYTDDEISVLRKLGREAAESGTDLNTLMQQLYEDPRSGREILLNSVMTVLDTIKLTLKDVKKAWLDVFGEPDSTGLKNFLKTVEKITLRIKSVVKRNAKYITSTFKGIFSVFDIGGQVLGGIVDLVKMAFGGLSNAINSTGFNFFEFTGKIGDNIYAFDQWLKQNKVVDKAVTGISTAFEMAVNAIKQFVAKIKDSNAFKAFAGYLDDIKGHITSIFGKGSEALKANPLWQRITERFQNFIGALTSGDAQKATVWLKSTLKAFNLFSKNGITKAIHKISDELSELYKKLDEKFDISGKINKLKSTKAYSAISNFIESIKDKFSKVFKSTSFTNNPLVKAFNSIISSLKSADFSSALENLKTFFNTLKESLGQKFGKIFEDIGDGITKLKETFSSSDISFDTIVESIKNFFKSLKKHIPNGNDKSNIINNLSSFWNTFSGILLTIGKFVKKNTGTIIAIGLFAAQSVLVFKAISMISSMFSSLSFLNDISVGLKKKFKGEGLKAVAEGIAILVGALAGLTLLVKYDWVSTTIAFSIILIFMIMLIAISNKASKVDSNALGAVFKGGTILAFAIGVLLVAQAMAKIAKIDPDRIVQASIVTGLIVAALVLMERGLPKINEGQKIAGNAGSFIGMAIAMYLIAISVTKLSKIKVAELTQAGLVLIALMAVFAIMEHAAKNVYFGSGTGSLLMALSILTLVNTLKILANEPTNKILAGLKNYIPIFAVMISLMIVARIAGKNAAAGGAGILLISAALAIITRVIEKLSKIPFLRIAKAISAIGAIEILIGVFMLLTQKVNGKMSAKDVLKMSASILAMSIAVGLLAAVVVFLGNIKIKNLAQGIGVVAVLTGLIDSMIFVASKCSNLSGDSLKPLVAVIGMLVVVLAAVIVLSILPFKKLLKSVIVVTAIVGSISLLLAVLSKWNKDTKISIKSIAKVALILAAVLVVVIVLNQIGIRSNTALYGAASVGLIMTALSVSFLIMSKMKNDISISMKSIGEILILLASVTAVIFVLTKFGSNLDQAIQAATAVGILMLALSTSFIIMSVAATPVSNLIPAVLEMIALLAGVAAVLGILLKFGTDFDSAISVATALGVLMLALSASFAIMAPASVLAGTAIAGVSEMLLLLAGVATIFGLLLSFGGNLDQALPVAVAISTLMLALSAAYAIIAAASVLAAPALAGIGQMLLLFTGGTGLIVLLGALEQINGFDEIIDSGISVMEKLATGLGTAFYNFISAAAPDIVTAIQNAANGLTTFSDDISGFMTTMSSADGDAIAANAALLASAVLYFAEADFLESISSFFGHQSAIEAFSIDLPILADALASLSDYKIDSDKADAVASTLQALADVQLDKQGGLISVISKR